jgi:hypothetical protein
VGRLLVLVSVGPMLGLSEVVIESHEILNAVPVHHVEIESSAAHLV